MAAALCIEKTFVGPGIRKKVAAFSANWLQSHNLQGNNGLGRLMLISNTMAHNTTTPTPTKSILGFNKYFAKIKE
jgi:hypothetical protein